MHSLMQKIHIRVLNELTIHTTTHKPCTCAWNDPTNQAMMQNICTCVLNELTNHALMHKPSTLFFFFFLQSMNLSEHHVNGAAAFVFHLSNNRAQFPPLFTRRHDSGQKQETAFLPVLLNHLPTSNETEMLLAHSYV